ncbi:MAG: NAD-dependent epimerase/dehydratase family protein, partial [Candidatus Cloacimonetes bacterium]|nr:NAD-dependent epimerase/dehydratase family protein [Candidatus Cloacimonadota bacterium]
MNILVTGGAGFIGSQVADRYLELGHRVIIVDNLSTGSRKNVNPAAEFVEYDIRDNSLQKIFREFNPDLVNHHAARISVPESVRDPLQDAEV